jgi:hypothetical protein
MILKPTENVKEFNDRLHTAGFTRPASTAGFIVDTQGCISYDPSPEKAILSCCWLGGDNLATT